MCVCLFKRPEYCHVCVCCSTRLRISIFRSLRNRALYCVCVFLCVFVCVYVCVCLCVGDCRYHTWQLATAGPSFVCCVCVRERERERECVCVGVCVYMYVCLCVDVCECVDVYVCGCATHQPLRMATSHCRPSSIIQIFHRTYIP